MIPRPPRSTLFPTRRSSDLTRHREERTPCAVEDELGDVGAHRAGAPGVGEARKHAVDRKSTRLNSSHSQISYAVFCLKKKKKKKNTMTNTNVTTSICRVSIL